MAAISLIVHFLFSVLVGACLLRFGANLVRLSMQNQPGPFILALTDWLVMPVRKGLLKSNQRWSLDWASLGGALGLSLVYASVFQLLFSSSIHWELVALAAIRFLVVTALNTVFYCVMAHAVLSWVQPHSQTFGWLERLIGPLLNPIRRMVPRIGGVDVSGVVLLLLLQVLLMVVG